MSRKRGPHRFKAETEVWVSPPSDARAAARWILRVRDTIPASRRGGTAAGVARAKSIAAGELQPAREISGWFARHAGYIDKAERKGLTVEESPALQSSLLWGSYPMLEATERALGPKENPHPPSGFLEGSVIKGSLYHGTDFAAGGGHTLSPSRGSEYGIYMSPSHRYARKYGSKLTEVRVNIKNPLVVGSKAEISPRDLTRADVRRLEREGYDGILVGDREVVAFRSNQVWVQSQR